MTTRWQATVRCGALLAAGLAGCFAINACFAINDFDDVVQPTSTAVVSSSTATGGGGGTGGTTTTSAGGSGGSGGAGGEKPSGIIAVAGDFLGQQVLYVLDRDSGFALHQQPLHVAALEHDGQRDAFYVFESMATPVTAETRGSMTVRSFDVTVTVDPDWTVLSLIENIYLPRRPQDVAVLRNRLAYLVDRTSPAGVSLTVLRTNTIENVQLLMPETHDVTPPSGHALFGMVGLRQFGDGGTVALLHSVDAGGSNCNLAVRTVTVAGDNVTVASTSDILGPVYPCASQPGFAVDEIGGLLLFAIPAATGDGVMLRYDPATKQVFDQSTFAVNNTEAVLRLDVAQCERIALIGEGKSDMTVTALPFGGIANTLTLGHPIDLLVSEGKSQRALAGYVAGDKFALASLALTGSCGEPKLVLLDDKSGWQAPIYLKPRIVATSFLHPPECKPDCSLPE